MPTRRTLVALGLAATAAPAVTLLRRPSPAAANPSVNPASDDQLQAFPRFVRLPDDQASKPAAAYEWWYVVGHVRTRAGRRFGYEVTINRSSAGPEMHAAITDEASRTHRGVVERYEPEETTFSPTALEVRTPDANLIGPMSAMRLEATLPGGRINMTLRHSGPALYPGGTGLIPFAGGHSYYYSLPSLATTGVLTIDGEDHRVRGESWLDRQWGEWHWEDITSWTWMAIHLDNGDRLNVWNLIQTGDDQSYVTILHPDGAQSVAPITPLAETSDRYWTSPQTGQNYPTRWRVEIPSQNASLVISSLVMNQELNVHYPDQPSGLYEADCDVTGTYASRSINGRAYVELYGEWG